MLFALVLVLNILSANCRGDVDDIGETYDDFLTVKDIEKLREDLLKCCTDQKAQAIDQANLINGIKSFMKSEIESMKNQLYTDISNKIKEELIDVKSKQSETINLVKYTRDGISNLTTEVNSIAKITDNMKNQLYNEFSNKIKEDLNDLRNQQNENINEIKKIIPELNRTASNLEIEISTNKESDKVETITQNQEVMSSLNESHGAVNAQLEKINQQIMKNTNSFARAHEDIKELQIKVNDIRNSSKQIFHLANAFSEKETVYECAEYETFKTKIESSVVEVAKVCSNDDTDQRLKDLKSSVVEVRDDTAQRLRDLESSVVEVRDDTAQRLRDLESSVVEVCKVCGSDDTVQRISDLKSKINSNEIILKSIQHSLKRRHNIQNTEGDISEQYRKLNDKLTTAMEDKLSKEYLIVKRDTAQPNICNADKVITAVSELGTNIKDKFREHKKNRKVLSAIRKLEINLKDNLLKTCNGCNDTLQHQLDKVMSITSATNELLTPKPLPKPCKNSKWLNAPGDMNVCKEVVKNQLCAGSLRFAFHCCRSCTRDKQVSKDGPHRYLNEPRRIDYFHVILST